MKTILIISLVMSATLVSLGAIPNVSDGFENLAAGSIFTNVAVSGWQASGTAAYVSNSASLAYAGTNAVFIGESVALTNILNASPNLKVWTDLRVKPMLGVKADDSPSTSSSLDSYFNSNGFMVVATASGWQECTNDVWGSPVPPATNGYARVSVFQDYNTSTQAVFLNDRLLIQDLRFYASLNSYSNLVILNTSSNCWLDNVWVQTNFDAATLTNDYNGDGWADAREMNTYGYARRTIYVCKTSTNLVPYYGSITNALAVWRPRDIIHVIAGDYSGETVVLAANPSNIVIEGDAFTVASLSVASNAFVSFAQSVSCGSLTVSGQMAMAGGASVTSSTASVSGLLSVSTNGGFVVTNLTVGSSGIVTFTTNAQLVAVTAGVTMNGPFAISNNCWNSASLISQPLPFNDNFDLYADGTLVTNLKFRGWYASDGSVKVQGLTARSGNAVVLPDGTTLSNSINTAVGQKIWSDFTFQPTRGLEPLAPATNTSSFLAYVNTNGYLVVAIAGGGWYVCSNQLDNTSQVGSALTAPIPTSGFTRISICQDLSVSPPKFAVFVAGNLVAQGLTAPASGINHYSSFAVDNLAGPACYMDDVLIAPALPSGLTNDLNHDGIADAYELNTYGFGLTANWPPTGTVFKIR